MTKDYFNTIYDKYWEKKSKLYGITRYEKYIIHAIMKRKPKKVFEVGIGNGYPIGVALSQNDIKVYGCNVAKSLVESARRNLHNDEIWVGELKNIKNDRNYDVVYCVRTSWNIPNFKEVLDQMISMMNEDGYLIFDIMDRNSLYFLKMSWDKLKTNLCKVIGLEREGERKLFFYSKRKIDKLLQNNELIFYSYNERIITKKKDYWNMPKRIYVCKKGK